MRRHGSRLKLFDLPSFGSQLSNIYSIIVLGKWISISPNITVSPFVDSESPPKALPCFWPPRLEWSYAFMQSTLLPGADPLQDIVTFNNASVAR